MDYTFHKLHASSFPKLHSQAAHVYKLSCVISALPCTSFITIKGDLEVPPMHCLGMVFFFSVSHTLSNSFGIVIARKYQIYNVTFVRPHLTTYLKNF